MVGLRCYLEQVNQNVPQLTPMAGETAIPSPVTIGFVPTMGSLHRGHQSLIERARRENDRLIVSIFVNPLQFAPTEDFDRYPRPLEADQALCDALGVDVLFLPTPEDLQGISPSQPGLPETLTQVIPPPTLTRELCGRSRPQHFQGVATVVTQLLNLMRPTRAYFGQKDAQQVAIIQQLVRDLCLPTQVVVCPIVRDADGLAISSRNQYLSGDDRNLARQLFQGLQAAQEQFQQGDRNAASLLQVAHNHYRQTPALNLDYLELVDPDRLTPLERIEHQGLLAVAAHIGTTRLIDNVILSDRQPIIAIDGPAGAGKSTVTQLVAKRLGLTYLDTGAMYRAVTWLLLEAQIPLTDAITIADRVAQCRIQFDFPQGETFAPTRVWINDRDVTTLIRSPEVTAQVSIVAAQPAVRMCLVREQQRYGHQGGLVAEGRDIGTTVFPNADLKIFLTASPRERAKRRQLDLTAMGQPSATLEELEAAIQARDHLDSSRSVSPLIQAPDAHVLETDGLTIEDVIQQIVQWYDHARRSKTNP